MMTLLKRFLLTILFLFSVSTPLVSQEDLATAGHMINFSDVPVAEFIKFASRIAKKTFVFKVEDLDFRVSFISGKTASPSAILDALFRILEQHHFKVKEEKDYVLIEKMTPREIQSKLGNLLDLKTSAWDTGQTSLSS
ncbi:MAG: hypothetical protein FJZ63_05270, partial [Chlamydiae bacterium]|nr:hypothetical protein [Chlamydiota bacterium]